MFGITTILRRSCLAAASENIMETSVGSCVSSGACLRWFSSCAKHSIKPGPSVLSPIKAVDRYSLVNAVSRTSMMPLCAPMDTNWLITSKPRFNALPGQLGVLSIRRAYSSDSGIKPEVPQNTVSNVPSTETSEFGTAGASGSTWTDILDNACKSTVDATTDASKKIKEMTDAITPHVQQFLEKNPDLEKIIVPLGGTLFGTMMAWFVMPIILRRLHKYGSQSPISALLGNSTKTEVSYQTSLWSALEEPAKYLITFMAFSEMAAVIAPSISAYLPQAWRGACVLSLVWFLRGWKVNFIAKAMTNQTSLNIDQARLSGFNKVASLGLIALGVMGVAEACGVAAQSILTIGGVGGVATAFAARDVLGNVFSGFSLQFCRSFSVGEYIKEILTAILAAAPGLETLEMVFCAGFFRGCTVESLTVRNFLYRPALEQREVTLRPATRLPRQRAQHRLLLHGHQQPDGGAVRGVARRAERVGGHEGAGRAEPDEAARRVPPARREGARPGHGALQRVLPGQPGRPAGGHRARQLLPDDARQGRRSEGRPPRRQAAQRDGGAEVAGALGVC